MIPLRKYAHHTHFVDSSRFARALFCSRTEADFERSDSEEVENPVHGTMMDGLSARDAHLEQRDAGPVLGDGYCVDGGVIQTKIGEVQHVFVR